MFSTVEIVTPPAAEPVTSSEVKKWLRWNTTDEDSLITTAISEARQCFEFQTDGHIVIATTFKEHFPAWDKQALWTPTRFVSTHLYTLQLSRAKVSAVAWVKYYDLDDDLQSLTDYSSDLTGIPALVYYQPTGITPYLSRLKLRPIQVQYTAGYADASSVPEDIKAGIGRYAAHLLERKDDSVPDGFVRLCSQYRTGRF